MAITTVSLPPGLRPVRAEPGPTTRRAGGQNRIMKKYFLYILKSEKDGKFYIGSTQDVQQRLLMHNNGRVKSTKARRPFQLKYKKVFKSINEARYAEWLLKNSAQKRRNIYKEL